MDSNSNNMYIYEQLIEFVLANGQTNAVKHIKIELIIFLLNYMHCVRKIAFID